MQPDNLLATARKLLAPSGRPRQSDLRRAMSTAYYAVFHQLCWTVADTFIGGQSAQRSTEAWCQAYRALDHSFAKKQCRDTEAIKHFPQAVRDIAVVFVDLQLARHLADYDPLHRLLHSEVAEEVDRADHAIRAFRRSPLDQRRAFAAWITFKPRR